jgi:hypothetical protein
VVLLIIAIGVILAYSLARAPGLLGRRENFTPQQVQAVHTTAQELFGAKGGGLTYSEYKTGAAERGQKVDPVLYTDVRDLWKAGRLTPGEVGKVM